MTENTSSQGGRSGGPSRSSGGQRSGDRRPRRPYRRRRRDRGKKTVGCGPRCIGRQVEKISYKRIDQLRRHVTDRGKIRPRRQTSTCAKHQRLVAREIKRARYLALLPFTADHTFTGGSR